MNRVRWEIFGEWHVSSARSGFGVTGPVVYSGERFPGQGVPSVVKACLQEEEKK